MSNLKTRLYFSILIAMRLGYGPWTFIVRQGMYREKVTGTVCKPFRNRDQ